MCVRSIWYQKVAIISSYRCSVMSLCRWWSIPFCALFQQGVPSSETWGFGMAAPLVELTLGSISTCSWSVGLQRSLHCFKIFKLLVHLRSPEWHSTLPNPAMNCIAWFIVFRSGCISARALQGYLPNAEFVSLTWGSLTHLGCRMSHWRLKTRLCFYWYWAYRFGLLPHMLAILLYNILHNVQR